MDASGLKDYTSTRVGSPVIWYPAILIYGAFGLWLVVYGIMIFSGHTEPIPLGQCNSADYYFTLSMRITKDTGPVLRSTHLR